MRRRRMRSAVMVGKRRRKEVRTVNMAAGARGRESPRYN
jgi:hypothetical protein